MNELFAVRISSRFVFVNLLPTISVVLLIGGLVAAGAPDDAPSWPNLKAFIDELSLPGLLIGAFGVLLFSVILHPLAYPMIKLLEGYWSTLPLGDSLSALASSRYRRWRDDLQRSEEGDDAGPMTDALAWLPPRHASVLPTGLGNVLQAGETRAGARYGYRTGDIWFRLALILPPATRAEVNDTRNQLDTAARLCVFGLMCVPTTLALLWSRGTWLLVPLACYFFAWASYRAAVAAAYRFSEAVAVAVDLHRLQLWDALSLDRPKDLREEQMVLAPLLCVLLRDGERLSRTEKGRFVYLEAPAWPFNQAGQLSDQQQSPPPRSSGGDAS